ncbi:MAG: segregation/condensation protein A [Christensenellaceae bacterium]|nr:segregation/condensation protein A [Christensenellaceae bacterium]
MNYSIKLAAYEGPLDLLLALISKAKIEIKDIFVSEITEQYLEYISQEGAVDMDSASDFVQMAATLLYIKSRALLPHANDDIDEDGLTPEERLIARLNAYKAFKTVGEKLKLMEEEGFKQYFKLPEELLEEVKEEVYLNADTSLLSALYLKMLAKKPTEKPSFTGVTVIKDTFSIREQIKLIIARLTIKPTMTFNELISSSPSREEIAVTFMSLLELVNKNKVSVTQEKIFGDIFVTKQ